MKPLAGENGQGVIVVKFEAGRYIVNGRVVRKEECAARVRNLRNYIVTERVEEHEYAKRLFPHTTNTVRILSMWDYDEGVPFIAAAAHRVGRNSSVPVDNFIAGGLACIVDVSNGILGPGALKPVGSFPHWFDSHPDTGSTIKGIRIPHWKKVTSTIIKMAGHLSVVPYMGWDIAVTNAGFKVIEINSLPSLNLMQASEPLLRDPRVRRFYEMHVPGLKAR